MTPAPAIGRAARLGALEDTGPVPYGYVKYKAQFNYSNEPKMFISTFADDAIKVFINGKLVEEALKPAKAIDFELAKYAKAGTNTLEIAYEAFGAYNGGKEMGDLKGIEFVRIGSDAQSGAAIDFLANPALCGAHAGTGCRPGFCSRCLESGVLPGFGFSGRTGSGIHVVPDGICVAWGRTGLDGALETDLRG